MVYPTFHWKQSSNKEVVRLEDFPLSAMNTALVQPAGTACQMIARSVYKFSWNAHGKNPTSSDFLPLYALRTCATMYCNKKPYEVYPLWDFKMLDFFIVGSLHMLCFHWAIRWVLFPSSWPLSLLIDHADYQIIFLPFSWRAWNRNVSNLRNFTCSSLL